MKHETVAVLERQLQAARDNGPTPQDFEKAIAYAYGRPRGDEQEGRSAIQSLDVEDMTNAIMAQLIPTFAGDTVCAFEPDGPEDENMARLETDAVNRVIMEAGRGYVAIYEATKNALRHKNGIIKAWLEEDDGERYIRTRAVDPANFFVSPGADCILFYEEGGCFEEKRYTRGELVEMGFSRELVDELPQEGESSGTQMRNRSGTLTVEAQTGWANEMVTVYEGYSHLDPDDSGETDLYRSLWGGETLLLQEKAETIPYAAGCAFLEPHKFWGLSLYDRLKTVQDSKTAIMRQWLDNLANCNNSRHAVTEGVNMDDYLNGRPGGAVRVRGVGAVSDQIMPLPSIDAGPAAQAYLGYMDQVRADRGGAALQMANAEAQLMGEQVGSMGVDRVMSVQEALAGLIGRTLAETLLRSLFMLVHRLLRTELKDKMQLRMADQWVVVNTAQFRPRVRVNIKAGLSPGERARKAANLAQIMSTQAQALQMGQDGTLVDLQNIYSAYMDWAAASDIDAPEKYFTDPRSQKSQMAAQQKGQQNQQMQAMQMQMAQAQLQIEQLKLQLDKAKSDAELQFKYYDARLSAEVEEAKLVGTATADLQRVELEGANALRQAAVSGAGGEGGSGPQRAAA